MDLVADTPRIPRAGETLTGTGFTTTPGGKGANQAVAVARLGYPVHMLGMVGEDVFGQALVDNLAATGVATDAIARVSGPSGVASILVSASGENSIVVVPGANGKVTPAFIDQQRSLIAPPAWFSASLNCPSKPSLTPSPSAPMQAFPSSSILPLPRPCLNPCGQGLPGSRPTRPRLHSTWRALPLPKRRRRNCLLEGWVESCSSAGSESAWLAQKGACAGVSIPTFPVEAIDTVAAGDCFNGAFAVALLEGRTPKAAASFAAAAAAISVTRRGAQASMPNRADVESFLSRHL